MRARTALAALLALLLLLPSAPALAPNPGERAQGWYLGLRSDGTVTVERLGAPGADRVRTCDGVAPLSNACSLTGLNTGFGWFAGFAIVPPGIAGAGSVSVYSARVTVTSPGSAGAAVIECDFLDAAALDHPLTRDFPFYTCAVLQKPGPFLGSTITADFHIGLYDPLLLTGADGGLNSYEAGVGSWQGILTTFFEN